MATTPGPYDLDAVRVIFEPDGSATPKPVTETFYAELDADFDGFRGCTLISKLEFDNPWPTWEMHPHGDELVYLLEGDTDFVLRSEGAESTVRISTPGEYVMVPRGAWHTARPHRRTVMLFVTPGAGTENVESPPVTAP